MTPSRIRAALRKKGLNFALVADALGVSAQSVSQVASRATHSRRIAHALARVLDLDVAEVFPDVPQYVHGNRARARIAKVEALKRTLAA